MKIKLIAPQQRWDNSISSAETFKIQKVNLPLLAALTPPEHSVQIVDEAFAPDHCDDPVDLVGISVVTDMVLRAYRIADDYRRRGIKVVMGGIHPTVLPEEALRHADAVVIGEAETTWPILLKDAAGGCLRQVYRADRLTLLNSLPRPKRSLYPQPILKSYTPLAIGVETSRGCPYDCDFCTVSLIMGRQLRHRPAADVIAELNAIDSDNLFFVDDALGLNAAAAKRLFREMIPLKKRWVGQGCVSLAEDPELLQLMRRSGCEGLLIGFESVSEAVLSSFKKSHQSRLNYLEAMRRFHGEGLAILGAFVFGADGESPDVFDRTLEFVTRARLDGVQMRILCPYPGTRLYQRLLAEGRLYDPHWWLSGHPPGTLLFRPRGMTPNQLVSGLNSIIKQFYSLPNILDRFFGVSPLRRTPISYGLYFGFNLANRKRYLRGLTSPQPFAQATV